MKKIFSFGAIAAAVMAFAGCAQEIEQPEVPQQEGVAYELVAEVSTKTVNDGMSTKWAEDDALNVFFTEAGSESYGSNNKFTIVDVEKGKFEGTLTTYPDPTKNYDWYALYPYAAKIQSPANDSAGYTYIGHSKGVTQSEYGSKDGLDDTNCPLYAVLKNHPGAERVSLTMAHLTSVIELKVTNGQDEELTINSAYISVPGQKIVGSFFINYAGDEVKYTPSGENYVKEFAQVNVTNPTALAKGETASLYFVVKPFVLAEGDTWSIAINDQNSAVEKNAPVEISFKAGEIFTVNYTYAPVASEEPETPVEPEFEGEWLLTGKVSNSVYAASAYASGNNLGVVVPISIADGKIMEVDGLAACKMTVDYISEGDYTGLYTIKDNNNQYLYAASSSNNHLKAKTTLDENCYWDITLNDNGTYKIIASKSANRNVMQFNADSKLFSCYKDASQAAVTLYPYSMVVPDLTPKIKVADTEAEVSADGGEVSFEYTLKNLEGQELSAAVSDSDILSVEVEDGVITVTVTANESEARSATVTLTCGEAQAVVLTVNQLGAPVSGEDVEAGVSYSYSFTAKVFSANGSKALGSLSWKIDCDGGYWGYDTSYGKGHQFGSSGKPCKEFTMSTSGYEGGVQKIVVNAAGASSISAKLSVSVGGVQYGSTKSLTSSSTNYEFLMPDAGMQVGEIKITITQTSSKAIYIKSIAIN